MNRLRLILAIAGFAVALLSVAVGDRWLVWAAIALLTASIITRLVPQKRDGHSSRRDD